MKKLFLILALMVPFASAIANDPHHRWHEHHGEGAGWFLGGLVLGGIIAHEVDGHYYDTEERELRRVSVCQDVVLYDQWNHPVYDQWGHIVTEHRCHDEWVRIDR